MARRRRLFEMAPSDPIAGIRMSAFALTDDETLRRGIRDVRDSPPPDPEDARRRAMNRAHAEEQKKKKDAKEAKRTKKLLAAEAQAGVQRGAASGGAISEEAATQEKGAEAAAERVEEEEPTPRNVVGVGANEAGASTIAEAIEGEAGAPKTSEVRAVDAGAAEVETAEARAPGSIEAEAMGMETEPAVSDGYVLPEDDEEADAEVVKLLAAAEAPGTALACLFEEEVVPPASAADP
ncbi:uncharacterized protein [Miscanthus floridulus]|uniref:uncharacterized protein n=1 Tax=Miscanthus floridulus TaxID=154761 RepID=UPI00345B4159